MVAGKREIGCNSNGVDWGGLLANQMQYEQQSDCQHWSVFVFVENHEGAIVEYFISIQH